VIQLFGASNNGGSQITNYEIQHDDGNLGLFTSVFQLSSTYTYSTNVTGGATYRFRYRAKNYNGWGLFGSISYIMAATVPGIPPAPVYVSSTSTTTTFAFLEPSNQGGSPVTGFKLYVDTLELNNNYIMVFSGNAFTHTVSTVDGLTTGVTYRYVLVASNMFGDSQFSSETRIALGNLPPTPTAPVKVESLSSITSISIAWSPVVSLDGVPITGYLVLMDNGLNGNFN
jgi:hypothetical protein